MCTNTEFVRCSNALLSACFKIFINTHLKCTTMQARVQGHDFTALPLLRDAAQNIANAAHVVTTLQVKHATARPWMNPRSELTHRGRPNPSMQQRSRPRHAVPAKPICRAFATATCHNKGSQLVRQEVAPEPFIKGQHFSSSPCSLVKAHLGHESLTAPTLLKGIDSRSKFQMPLAASHGNLFAICGTCPLSCLYSRSW